MYLALTLIDYNRIIKPGICVETCKLKKVKNFTVQ